jgi:hypothetical protein
LDELQITDDLHGNAFNLLVKLSANTNILPTSLFVHGVDIDLTRDAHHCGMYVDIYRGHHQGKEVAVKKFRSLGSQKALIYQIVLIHSFRAKDH